MEAYQRTLAKSYLISCDMAHAIHPSFPSLHEDNLRPQMNKGSSRFRMYSIFDADAFQIPGPVIKTNSNQRYASTSQTTFLLRRVAKLAAVALQEYGVRNDCACGSTIGPLVSKIGESLILN